MTTSDTEELHPLAAAVLEQAIGVIIARDTPPETLLEKTFDLREAEAACDRRKSDLASCIAAERKLEAQEAEYEARGEEQFMADGLVSAEITIALTALTKSKSKASAATAAARSALESAKTNLEVRRAIRNKEAVAWSIHSKEGPAKVQEHVIGQFFEVFPMVLLKSARIYEEARSSFHWKYWEHPSGPAGALLAALQQMRWPEGIRPSWSPRAGPCPTPQEVLNRFAAMLPQRKSASQPKSKETANAEA